MSDDSVENLNPDHILNLVADDTLIRDIVTTWRRRVHRCPYITTFAKKKKIFPVVVKLKLKDILKWE